ncbi:MAG: ribosomal protein S18-alanine N-acetyltransferase [Lachnospiraceae bacterium]|nr:ribosomal protein S18-alanine N-acetyltransferase [Lachnospiraceae bacterium]
MIRLMNEQDVERVYAIACESFTDAWSRALLSAAVNNANEYCIVYDIGGNAAGFAILSMSVDTADIEDIAVACEFRRRGIADRMLESLTEYGMSKGIRGFALEVRKSNAPAIALYKKNGFVTESCRKSYYKNPVEDAYVMWKRYGSKS